MDAIGRNPRFNLSVVGWMFRPFTRWPYLPNILALGLFEVAFYFAYRFGMSFSHACASPFWFPDSVLLCALLLNRPGRWWIIILGVLPIRLLVAVPPGVPVWFLLTTFAIDSVKGLLLAIALRRFTRDPLRLTTVREFAGYCLFAVVLMPAAAFVGAAARKALGNDYWKAWEQWFMGNALTHLVVTPAILFWVVGARRYLQVPSGKKFVEGGMLTAGLILTGYLAFDTDSFRIDLAETRFYAPVPFLFWAAVRFGTLGVSGAITIIAFLAVQAALDRRGIFSGQSPGDTALALQHFLLLRAAPLYLVAISLEQKKGVERSLRESEARFRNLADTAPVMIWMSGPDKLCNFFNKGWLDFTGRTVDQELGNGWTDGVHPDDFQRCLHTYTTSFDLRQEFTMQYRLRRRGGEYAWVLDTGVPRLAADGAFLGYIGSCMDITTEKEGAERFRLVVEASPSSIVMVNGRGIITLVNTQAETTFGYPRDEFIGLPIESIVPERYRARHTDYLVSYFASPAAVALGAGRELFGRRRDGSDVPIEIELNPIQTPEGPSILASIMDITDRKRAEAEVLQKRAELAHASRVSTMGQLASALAHELRQPLSAILLNAEAGESVVKQNPPDYEAVRAILADIRQDNQRASAVIDRMGSLLKRRNPEFEPLSVEQLIDEVTVLVRAEMLVRRVTFQVNIPPGLPPVQGDRVHLQQVILNLLVNGADAVSGSPVERRRLEVQAGPAADGTVEVAVRDTGHGIAETKLAHIFEPFFTTKPNGMGMGLAISKTIVELHGGRIWAENNAEGGATFRFTVKVAGQGKSKRNGRP
jgi:two-component system, LuxR family, sensor kinase FixL